MKRSSRRLPAPLGVLVAVVAVAITTAVLSPLADVAPAESLGVAYVVPVLLVSWFWPGSLGYLTAVASAAAFNWFLLPPTGRFGLAESENWVALAVLVVAALVGGSLAQRARSRARELEHRRAEADLSADMARLMLRGGRLAEMLPAVSRRFADALGLPSASIVLGAPPSGDGETFPLREDGRLIGALVVPSETPVVERERIGRHVVPSLEALLAAALEREQLLEDVVETAALRRSDVLKTALLRAVSHDLRSPLTAILTSKEALRSTTLTAAEHEELVEDIGTEATRLSRLIEQLLDLGQLEARTAAPAPMWCSVAEVIEAAVDQLGHPPGAYRLSLDKDLPQVRADAAQLERAFANLLENAARYSGGHPVSVRARHVAHRILVRIVDRGPGLPEGATDRIFEPFYRSGDRASHRGSGLGLAIVRGVVEVNGGKVRAESVPGQGTTFVVELPVDPAAGEPAPARAPAPATETPA